MSKVVRYIAGTVVTTGVVVAGVALYNRRKQALPSADGASPDPAHQPVPSPAPSPTPSPSPAPSPPPAPQPKPAPKPTSNTPIQWDGLMPLPTAAEVKGDLTTNWGNTPTDLRPLLLLVEEATGISGAARLLAIIGYRESRFRPTAHNGDDGETTAETNASWRAYHNNKDRNPPLMYGEAAAAFGSGGLFGHLAPYFLWTGVQELGSKAPLLNSDPRIMFLPRVSAFAAAVYLQRLLANYDIRDHADIKVGWGSISLLSAEGRKDSDYARIRERFFEDAKTLGIDLADVATIPAKLRADKWPGVAKVFEKIVVKLPTPGKVIA